MFKLDNKRERDAQSIHSFLKQDYIANRSVAGSWAVYRSLKPHLTPDGPRLSGHRLRPIALQACKKSFIWDTAEESKGDYRFISTRGTLKIHVSN